LARADAWRTGAGRTSLAELDGRERFGAAHLAGENAAALIYVASAMDAAALAPDLDVVAVCGNSMGWYTALHVSGALDFDAGLRLADTMGTFQRDGLVGGQVLVPVVDEAWGPDPLAQAAVEGALQTVQRAGHQAWISIRLGGYLVLAGDQEAVRLLLKVLPRSRVGEREYPFQMLGHSAFHTPLMAETGERGRIALADLPSGPPAASLVDGTGRIWRPLPTRPADLLAYTLGRQVVETFDFTTCVRVLLREFAPDALVLLGPGDSLGGVLGQILVSEGWAGLRSKQEFAARQRSEEPILYAMGRPEQYRRVAATP
jgi:acyl transferase domain-containing protein